MQIYALLSRLLDYPEQELMDNLPLIERLAATLPGLAAAERGALAKAAQWMGGQTLLDLQAAYVGTFDMTPEHSLHLTHHTFGDDRERGPALVELGEHYRAHGLEAGQGELPDYLPLILEYASTLDELSVQFFLGEASKVLDLLAGNLEKIASPYAPLIRMVERRGRLVREAA